MLSLLSKLQRKPERVRQRIAIAASAVITGIIVVIWLTTLRSSIGEPVSSVRTSDKDTGPFQALTEQLSTFFLDASETIQTMTKTFSNPEGGSAEVKKEEDVSLVGESH